MALKGFEDPRWIVTHRDDGKNVNNWHWTETDFTGWAKIRLGELLENQKIETNNMSCTLSSLTLKGEVSVNTRKQKTILFYELDVSLQWEGTWLPTSKSAKGSIRMPYISEENKEDDFEIQVTVDEGQDETLPLKDELRKNVIPVLKEKVPIMLMELKEVTSQKTKLPPKQQPITSKALESVEINTKSVTTNVTKIRGPKLVSFQCREKFVCSPRDLFECLTVPARVKAYAGGDAIVSSEKGGKFKLFGGSVEGEIIEIDPPKKIVQKWRFSTWPEGLYSTVKIELEEKDGKTHLLLEQTGVPEDDKERTENGWSANFWRRIKGIFGFGPIV